MDTQTIIVLIVFALAVFYISRLVYKAVFVKKQGCGSNCKCGVDFSNTPSNKK